MQNNLNYQSIGPNQQSNYNELNFFSSRSSSRGPSYGVSSLSLMNQQTNLDTNNATDALLRRENEIERQGHFDKFFVKLTSKEEIGSAILIII